MVKVVSDVDSDLGLTLLNGKPGLKKTIDWRDSVHLHKLGKVVVHLDSWRARLPGLYDQVWTFRPIPLS